MGYVTSTLDISQWSGRYMFVLIEWNDYAYPVRDELHRQAGPFGMDLGPDGGVLVQVYPQRMYEVVQQIVQKPWPSEIAERFQSDQDPFILILEHEWKSFDPNKHPYGIIWISRFSDNPEAIRPFLQQLARRGRRGDDLIAYLHDLAVREQRAAAVDRTQESLGLLARFASYIELKPRVFGVAIDLKAILRDISEHHH